MIRHRMVRLAVLDLVFSLCFSSSASRPAELFLVHVYWLCPGKELIDGLVPLVTDDDLVDMRRQAKVHKTLVIFVDHTNFIRLIRAELVRARAAIGRNDLVLSEEAASTSIVVAQDLGQECVQSCADDSDSDSSADSDFFDSDYDAESGDDDLFLDNVDTDLHDNNEIVLAPDLEDDSQLEDRDLNLEEGERLQLEYRFAKFLCTQFINEFRDNQKMDLTSFAAKVQRKYNLCPERYKLGRARKAALLEIHGNEEAQFSLLRDYGEELKRANPGSTFFLSTNSVKETGSDIVKEHLATMYWSYDACKRGFLSGCRPLICVDGCHIKTRYKGVLLTAVGIDPNDCIFPIAMGMVEVECTSSWEWFLTTLRDDLNITNTSPWTIMSDRQKGLINAVEKVFPDAEHRTDKLNPENLVHSCYTVDTYNRAYGFNLAPLRGRIFWDKVDAAEVHPPLFTKVMGRPKKNRRKAPEEKMKKGVKVFTRAGVHIHCSTCGKSGHNKKGHIKFVQKQMAQQLAGIVEEDEEYDIPDIMLNLFPQNPDPTLDPSHRQDHMVYMMGQEEATHVPIARATEPLPESEFVVNARESMPLTSRRMTTATTRGRGRARAISQRGRGRGRNISTTSTDGDSARGRARGRATKKRSGDASTSGTAHQPHEAPAGKKDLEMLPQVKYMIQTWRC
ncbi:hypothetical protein QYE76_054981 [Lolium multiflorum]|uniref:MULE transposase domain-containing protein n=1 Tax=Lolium multiflorum TaxID=4521 RepID=A0AAD8SYZ5_LOLMU|nr:hypothetical protein QYE76_054981 [Lolium multiflorum]